MSEDSDTVTQGSFRALAGLHGDYRPLRAKASPRFSPEKQPPCWDDIAVPVFTWWHPRAGESDHLRLLDVNGAFLAPLSGTEWAFNSLTRTGRLFEYEGLPGFYQLAISGSWPNEDIPSPLGTAGRMQRPGRVWLAHPTVQLLHELVQQGKWPALEITDSYTCPIKVRPVKWANWLRDERAAAHLARDKDRYDAIKIGYGQAVVMMISGKGSPIHRPDWGRAVQAQHAANTWRKMWRAIAAGHGPLGMEGTDVCTFDRDELAALQAGPAPLKFDDTGLVLGAFKVKGAHDWDGQRIISWERS